ncbi:MAG TPA: hypothetical protein VMY18_02370, partial [Acidobacteriota bacterium]|nr:hypothetical protein [Acidobacteriota bacterium]
KIGFKWLRFPTTYREIGACLAEDLERTGSKSWEVGELSSCLLAPEDRVAALMYTVPRETSVG